MLIKKTVESTPDRPTQAPGQRWKKMAAAAAPRVLIIHISANFWVSVLFFQEH